jgi:hypothetical protein
MCLEHLGDEAKTSRMCLRQSPTRSASIPLSPGSSTSNLQPGPAAPVPNSHWHGTSRTLAPIERIKAPESETRQLQKRTELRVSMGKRRFGIERFAWDEADQLQQ